MTTTAIDTLLNSDRAWLTDAGLETSIIFHDGIDLPLFASFHLLENDEGIAALDRYFDRYIRLAKSADTGFLIDTTTWRSGAFWAEALGRSEADMEEVTRNAVRYALVLKQQTEAAGTPTLINGVIGPAGDGYQPDALWSVDDAEAVHTKQTEWLASAGADIIAGVTITHTGEGIGLVRAAKRTGLPVVLSYTVETDGYLPTGQSLGDAIAETDAATGSAPVFYMVNCAHPDHFKGELAGDWTSRIGGIRANASRMSHAELDEAEELDDGNPEEFGALYGEIALKLGNLRVIGGCCGSDDRHVACAARHVIEPVPA